MPDVTVALLIYRSPGWLTFVLDGLSRATNKTPYELLVVANDPTAEIAADPRVSAIHRNPDPMSHYLGRVYAAWNATVAMASTRYVCLLNSDMYVSDGWLDALMAELPGGLPTSLLVESGFLPSAMPEYVRDFGRSPSAFRREDFLRYAGHVRDPERVSPGRLCMPVIFERQIFLDAGGYPLGNFSPRITGDRLLFMTLAQRGLQHRTCHGSVVYHVQEGEMRRG